MKKLWYDKQADVWEEALPIGNGRIGSMFFSGALSDRVQINEETLWSGYPNMESHKWSFSQIEEIRELIRAKNYKDATTKTSNAMSGAVSQAYLSYGNLFIDIIGLSSDFTDYRRELDMENGIVRSGFRHKNNHVTKEAFVSLTDDVLVINIKSNDPLSFQIYQAVEMQHSIDCTSDTVICTGKCPTKVNSFTHTVEYDNNKESILFSSQLKARSHAHIYASGNSLWVDKATELTVCFSIKTSFNGYDKMPASEGKEYLNATADTLNKALNFSYDELKHRHIAEYKKYFDRVSLRIDGENFAHIPTDIRIKNAADGVVDNELTTLLFDYARYLTITSSICGTQPMNLQGIWSYQMTPPWNSNYTMNINTQMNYWAVETCNLGECHTPLFEMLNDFAEKGNNLGLDGWASWHNSDIWRFNIEATDNAMYGFWPMGGFWASRHIWEHYLHTRNIDFLKRYYPVLAGAAAFLEAWLSENDKGELVSTPSTSPENVFVHNNEICAVCDGSAMDMSIIYDLFDKTIKSAKILGIDTAHYEEIKARLTPVKIGKDGRILEWGEEFTERELGHRHISHLYGFFPSDILDYDNYSDAVKRTLETRLENGGGHTGWSNAWIANVYARLKDGEKVNRHIINMFKKSIYPNLFDAHPPFQIDGNFGIASAICEALMQSHTEKIELLPALPKEWQSGEVKGFVTRTGETINFSWKDGKILQ